MFHYQSNELYYPVLKNECRTYYHYLQGNLIDPRNNRGKRHNCRFGHFGVLAATVAGEECSAPILSGSLCSYNRR